MQTAGTDQPVHPDMIHNADMSQLSWDDMRYMSHIMRKIVYAIREQQRRRSACASTQFDQHLCCSLPR